MAVLQDGRDNASYMRRIDPKVFFSNERTFLKWLHMSVTLGSISSGLLGFNDILKTSEYEAHGLRYIALSLLLLSIFFCGYAIATYKHRNKLLNAKESNGYADLKGPLIYGSAIALIMSLVYGIFIFQSLSST